MNIKRILWAVLITICVATGTSTTSAGVKFDINAEYEINAAGIAKGGTKFVKVMAYGKNTKDAMEVAKMDAVAGALFRGIPGAGNIASTPPIIRGGDADYHKNKEYFNKFFSSGDYLQYVNFTNRDIPSGTDNLPTKKGHRVGVFIQIMWDSLLKRMIQDGMATPIQESAGKLKPVIMVIPSTAWMKQNNIVNAQGELDYRRALEFDNDIREAIGGIEDLMKEKGIDAKSLAYTLDDLDAESARMMVATTKGGGELQTSPLDELSKVASADIFVEIDVVKEGYGSVRQYNITLNAMDASSNQVIKRENVPSTPSAAPMSVLVKECLLNYIDPFYERIQNFFEDVNTNGREGKLILKIGNDAPLNFESEVEDNGEIGELQDWIANWMEENSVNGTYNKTRGNEATLVFENVRMPLQGKKAFGGKKMKNIDAEGFAKNLAKALEKFGFDARVEKIALGKAYIYLGSK